MPTYTALTSSDLKALTKGTVILINGSGSSWDEPMEEDLVEVEFDHAEGNLVFLTGEAVGISINEFDFYKK